MRMRRPAPIVDRGRDDAACGFVAGGLSCDRRVRDLVGDPRRGEEKLVSRRYRLWVELDLRCLRRVTNGNSVLRTHRDDRVPDGRVDTTDHGQELHQIHLRLLSRAWLTAAFDRGTRNL